VGLYSQLVVSAGPIISTANQSLAEVYLEEAVAGLAAMGDPEQLYGSGRHRAAAFGPTDDWVVLLRSHALRRRARLGRASVLFAALAAEANVNVYAREHLPKAERQTLDGLPTIEKYAIIPRIVTGSVLLRRGEQPLQALKELFELRNLLVHPKPKETDAGIGRLSWPNPNEDPRFKASRVAYYILAVRQAAAPLTAPGIAPLTSDGFDQAIGAYGQRSDTLPGLDDDVQLLPVSEVAILVHPKPWTGHPTPFE